MKTTIIIGICLLILLSGCNTEPEYCKNYWYHFGKDKLTDCCFYQKYDELNSFSWRQWNHSSHDLLQNMTYKIIEFEYSGKPICLNSIASSYDGCKFSCNEVE